MQKLYSHGTHSDLTEHTLQVAWNSVEAERIARLCHDALKATESWQRYVASRDRDETLRSPHRHAVAGALLACAVLRLLRYPIREQLAALHATAAHHSLLELLNPGSEFEHHLLPGFASGQAKTFFQSILLEHAGVEMSITEEAWRLCKALRPAPRLPAFWKSLQDEAGKLTAAGCLEVAFTARSWLGELVRLDHLSAASQKCGVPFVPERAEPENFSAREMPAYVATTELHVARSTLLQEALKLPIERFRIIKAATGLGKTNVMLCAAERTVEEKALSKVIYAVPVTSVGDQLFTDYLQDVSAQIYDHRRKEKVSRSEDDSEPVLLADAEEPFGSHYNVTTFNQVFLAMIHPNRRQCVKAGGLRDAVVILDEFHKLPFHLQRPLLELAKAYGEKHNVWFILGSATSLPVEDWVPVGSVPEPVLEQIHATQFIQNRRVYHKVGKLTPTALLEKIPQLHRGTSTLVVVNLVSKGTFALGNLMGIAANPFTRLGGLPDGNWERLYEALPVWHGIKALILDSTMPPFLRKRILPAVKPMLAAGREVLVISTQVVEVGVDLDFEVGIIDWQGLASTLQRGGRVGREGGAPTRDVYVFELVDDEGTPSYIMLQNLVTVPKVQQLEKFIAPQARFFDREQSWYRRWNAGDVLKDKDLTAALEALTREVHRLAGATDWRSLMRAVPQPRLGFDMAALQYLAQLYDEDAGESVILFESPGRYLEVKSLIDQNRRKAALKLIQEREISSFSTGVLDYILTGTRAMPDLEEFRCAVQES